METIQTNGCPLIFQHHCHDEETAHEIMAECERGGATVTLTVGDKKFHVQQGSSYTRKTWTVTAIPTNLNTLSKALLLKPHCQKT